MGLRNAYGNNDGDNTRGDNINLLRLCKEYWDGLYNIRLEAKNNRKMLHGYQWTHAELQAIKNQGRRAITHNIISQIMANLTGQYLASKGQPIAIARKRESAQNGKMMSLAIEHCIDINHDSQQDTKQFVRLATAGLICSRIDFGYINEKDRCDIITQNINPHTLFFTPLVDDGTKDNIDLIGTICEDSIDGLIVSFAKDGDDADFIKEIYNTDTDTEKSFLLRNYASLSAQNSSRIDNMDFFLTEENSLCRYYEVWTKERRLTVRYHDTANGFLGTTDLSLHDIDLINQERIMQCVTNGLDPQEAKLINAEQRYEFVWHYRFITPQGYILQEGDSPFKHQKHPYVLSFFDVMDGQIHPVISNITELQREINHLYMQADFMNGNGAKGILFFDKKLFASSGISSDDIKRGWSSFNAAFGVDVPQGKTLDGLIRQFYTTGNVQPILNLYANNVSMAQQIIGVNQAIQGQAPKSGTPSSRYAQETANAQLNSKPFIEAMAEFKLKKYRKMLSLIQQYYDRERYLEVAGKENLSFNPDINDIDFDLSITQEITAANYSVTEDDKLFELVRQGFLPFDMYCELSHNGFAKQALELIKQRQQEQASQQSMLSQAPSPQSPSPLPDALLSGLQNLPAQEQSEEEPAYAEEEDDNDTSEQENPPQQDNRLDERQREEQLRLLQQFLNK
ncbi:MAG: hypothetical protein IJ748_06410 [Bacteroidales bacterium]|nr:hypothetical protein [Bacteroidales bacterium]